MKAVRQAVPRSLEFRLYVIFASLFMLSLLAVEQNLAIGFESHLATHMILEHAIFFLLGADSVLAAEAIMKLLSAGRDDSTNRMVKRSVLTLWKRILQLVYGNVRGWIWVFIALALMAFWHLPYFFTMAVLNPEIHILQHISFTVVGAAGFIATRLLGDTFRIVLLVTIIGMMGFAGLLFSVLAKPIYPVYSLSDHNDAGGYMVMVSTVLLLVALPAYLIKRSMAYVRTINSNANSGSGQSSPP